MIEDIYNVQWKILLPHANAPPPANGNKLPTPMPQINNMMPQYNCYVPVFLGGFSQQ